MARTIDDIDCTRTSEIRHKTSELVRKGIWTHILAYNLIRTLMAQAASHHLLQPREISFKRTVQTLEPFQPLMSFHTHQSAGSRQQLHLQFLEAVATHPVANRPDRFEPRKRKRNPSKSEMMTTPRWELKRLLRIGVTNI